MSTDCTATVLTANLQTIIIDRGRKHGQSTGLTESGPMDEHAFLWSNHLLDNNSYDACIEIALGGLSLQFTQNCTVAIAGADMRATLNNKPIGNWLSLNIQKGDTLTFGFSKFGNYNYLAIKGGWQCPSIYSSKSCVLREKLGGHNKGKALTKGDSLSYQSHAPVALKATPYSFQHFYHDPICKLAFIPAYQFEQFSLEDRQNFTAQQYHLSTLTDRMGFQLAADIPLSSDFSIISEPIAFGSIQITHSGEPIVLMRDRQTIGGYPKIGVVISTDVEKLAQCKSGKNIQFTATSIEQALKLKIERETFFK